MAITLLGGPACAQGITVDGRLSPAQTLAGPNYAIGAGLGRQVGGNLFHSFGAFGLNKGETATFSGLSSVGNVIGRVTGGTASSINGGIVSTIPGANLYLINPAGVVFGPNASVNVSGSFHASSADYLRLKDGARFQATNPNASTFSAAPPEAFGFLSANPQAVRVNGSALQLTPGHTLGLVGGPVTISNGYLRTQSGTVHVASAAGPGEVPVDPRAGPAPTVARSGRVQVTNGTDIRANRDTRGNSGSVFITAGDLSVSASAIEVDSSGPGVGGVLSLHGDRTVTISNGAAVRAFAAGSRRGQDISIATAAGGVVTLDAATVSTTASGTGGGGAVAIDTGALTLRNGAVVLSEAQGGGDGGPINVAADSVLLDGSGTRFTSTTSGMGLVGADNVPIPAGASGNISLTGGTLTVQNGALIQADTTGSGAGGSISAVAAQDVTIGDGASISSGVFGGGTGGSISIAAARNVTMRGGGIISSAAQGSASTAIAGGVAITAKGALTLNQGSYVAANSLGNSNASTIRITAGGLTLTDSSNIQGLATSTGRGADILIDVAGDVSLSGTGKESPSISNSSEGSGNAGNVTVNAGMLTLSHGGAIVSNAFSSGVAGTVRVNAGSISVLGGAISSSTDGTGAGGSVLVTTPGALTVSRGGGIVSTASASGNAGEVALSVGGALTVDAAASGRSANGVSSEAVAGSSGSAGTVRVHAGNVSVLNGGFINSSAGGTGAGGSVLIVTPGALLVDGRGVAGPAEISASSTGPRSGAAGTVSVDAGSVSVLKGGVVTSNTHGAGGSVLVTTPGALLLDGQGVAGTAIAASTSGARSGGAGTVTVNAGTVAVQGGAQIAGSSAGSGLGGDVTINAGALTVSRGGAIVSIAYASGNAGEVALNVGGALTVDAAASGRSANGVSSEAVAGSSGSAGTVRVHAGNVSVLNGGFINSSTNGAGAGGSVLIVTPGALLVDGRGVAGPAEISASSTGPRSGAAGTVSVDAGSVSVLKGGVVTSITRGTGAGGSVLVTTPGALLLDGQGVAGTEIAASAVGAQSGSAGTVAISAGTVAVQGGAQIASSNAGPGRGGDVGVTAGSSIDLLGPGPQITATSTGTGAAGSIAVSAPRVALRDGAGISTEAQAANGGNIAIGPGDLLYLQRSAITTSVNSAFGNGGNVTIDSRFVVLNDSLIEANAVGGDGGNVVIRANQFVQSADSAVTATSQLGVSGEIFVIGPLLNLNSTLVVLASDLRSAAALLREGCAARGAGPRSSLVVAGRGGQRQGLEATLPALYFVGRPVRDDERRASQAAAVPARTSIGLSSRCG